MQSIDISIVIPCYRSEKLVGAVIEEIGQTLLQRPQYTYEIIAVNDCSPDNVLHILQELCAKDTRIKVLDLAKNSGKHAALMAGYRYASGTVIVSMDDDGQCPVDHFWDLLAPLNNGYDISIARYPAKKQSRFKNFGSWLNDKMTQILLKKPRDVKTSNFSAMKRFVCQEIIRYQNPYPYVTGLLLRTTGKIANVLMEERERAGGSSGYTFFKSLDLWLNGFTAFSVLPLRVATVIGGLFSVIGFLFGIWVIIHKFLNPEMMAGYSSIMAVIVFVGGILMLMLGLIGEYVGRIYISLNNSPQYVIRGTINIE